MSLSCRGRLLIVDDEVELMTALREGLVGQGYDADGFTSGEDAIEALRAKDFDVLLTDLIMPGTDGIALLREALGIDPDLVGIVMTGQGTIQTAVDAMKTGAFDYVLKPFKLSALTTVLSRAMQVRILRMENLRLRETVAVHELCQAIAFTLDMTTILNKVADAALQQCNAEEAAILLPADEGNAFYVAAVRGAHHRHVLGQRIPIEKDVANLVDHYQEPLVCEAGCDGQAPTAGESAWSRYTVSMPMVVGGRLVGILIVDGMPSRRPFTLGQIKGLTILVSTAAYAVESARLYAQAQATAQDLERRVNERTAELTAVNKELESFSYSVSHDLRAPLRSIDGFSQLLLEEYEDKLDAQGRRCLHRVREASQRMGRLIDDLLKLSRVTRSEIYCQAVDLSATVREIAAELQRAEPRRRAEFDIAPDVTGLGDARLLRIMLENLVGNAWKFTAKHRTARIEFGVTEQGGKRAYYVRDDGAGFDMAYADKLFGAFQRLHEEGDFPGTGIGLATVQRIVHRHGGVVWAEGTVERGATFYFTLG